MRKEPRAHWSFSAINQYLRCPLQYYFERVLKIPRKSVGSGLILGSAFHHALAIYHGRLKTGQDVGWDDVQQGFLENWHLREKEVIVEYKPKESRDDLIAKGLELLKLYLEEPPPAEIIAVEQRLMVPLQNSEGKYLELPLLAFIDLVTREEGILKVNEFKTSGRSYGNSEVEMSLQATCYVLALREKYDEWPTVEFTVLVKTVKPKLQRKKTARDEYEIGRLGDLVEIVERGISNNIFYPVETPMNCSICAFRQQCKDWKPKRSSCEDTSEVLQLNGATVC